MKKILISISCMLLCSALLISGDKAELKWRSFDDGFAEAKKNDKKIMLDVYTDWCKWCKKLDSDTYENSDVAKYLNKQYVVIKLNAESSKQVHYKDTVITEMDLARSFGVSGYPSIIFFEPSGEPITLLGGYLDASKFLPVLNYIGENYYKTMKWEEFTAKVKAEDEKNTSKK